MTYTAWSVVAYEQPTAAKWNQLGENDAGFRDGTNILDDVILARHLDWDSIGADGGIWWEELGRHTLGSTADLLTVSGITARRYLEIIGIGFASANTIAVQLRFNNDSGNNYAWRRSNNGAADGTSVSTNAFNDSGVIQNVNTIRAQVVNTAAQEKMGFYSTVNGSLAGAGNAPNRQEGGGKWSNTSDAITRVDMFNSSSGDFAAGSTLIVLGHD